MLERNASYGCNNERVLTLSSTEDEKDEEALRGITPRVMATYFAR